MIQDAVVPRSRLPEVLDAAYRHCLAISTAHRECLPRGRWQSASVDLF